ncbi:MAG: YgaP family membrane protein [Microbacterium sp.]
MSVPRAAGGLRWTRVCAVSRTERAFRAAASVFLAAFALSMPDNLWCAIPAGVCSALLMVGAVTGWCPTNLLPRRVDDTAPNALGIPEARQRIDV